MKKISFATTAFNEAENLKELVERCQSVADAISKSYTSEEDIEFQIVILDNKSVDNTKEVLNEVARLHTSARIFLNRMNYGPEYSAMKALEICADSDYIVLLCSDLQDPPELAMGFIQKLLLDSSLDGCIGIKKKGTNAKLAPFRRLYYKMLGLTSRLENVPYGYHGFGCYTQETVRLALDFWRGTGLNMRQCLINSMNSRIDVSYVQDARKFGRSSYRGFGYLKEAIYAIVMGDATASRISMWIGMLGVLAATILAIVLTVRSLSGNSGYEAGTPTIMILVLTTFSVQSIMISINSRQIESARLDMRKSKVSTRELV